MRLQDVEWKVDAVELAIILGTVLELVDHLQRRAQRIGISPGRSVLAMHVEHETADRHGRVPAIVHELLPVGIAALGHVLTKGSEKIERMDRCKGRPSQNSPERDGGLGAVGLAEQRVLKRIKARKFVLL